MHPPHVTLAILAHTCALIALETAPTTMPTPPLPVWRAPQALHALSMALAPVNHALQAQLQCINTTTICWCASTVLLAHTLAPSQSIALPACLDTMTTTAIRPRCACHALPTQHTSPFPTPPRASQCRTVWLWDGPTSWLPQHPHPTVCARPCRCATATCLLHRHSPPPPPTASA